MIHKRKLGDIYNNNNNEEENIDQQQEQQVNDGDNFFNNENLEQRKQQPNYQSELNQQLCSVNQNEECNVYNRKKKKFDKDLSNFFEKTNNEIEAILDEEDVEKVEEYIYQQKKHYYNQFDLVSDNQITNYNETMYQLELEFYNGVIEFEDPIIEDCYHDIVKKKQEMDEGLANLHEEHEKKCREIIRDPFLLNSFLDNSLNQNEGKLSMAYRQRYHNRLNVSIYNIIVQVGDLQGPFIYERYYGEYSIRLQVYDSKYHYNVILKTPLNPLESLEPYSVIQILKISTENYIEYKEYGTNIFLFEYIVLSNGFSNLIYKNTIMHPSFYYFNYWNTHTNYLQVKTNINSKVIELVSGLNKLQQLQQQQNQIFTGSDNKSLSTSLSLITPKYNYKVMAVYLLSHLNDIVETGKSVNILNVVNTYVAVLSKFGCLNTINSIHSFYLKSCNKSPQQPQYVKHLIGLFDHSLYLIKNNLLIQNEMEWESNLINQLSSNASRDQVIQQLPLNQQLIMVYNQDVFEFGNSVKPEQYCDNKQFSIDHNRSICEHEYKSIEPDDNPTSGKYYVTPENGSYSINPSLSLFKKCFSIFTNGIFDDSFDWGNENDSARVVVSGSSVLACLDCLPYEIKFEYCQLQSIKRLLYKSRLPKILVPKIMKLVENNSNFEQLLFNRYHGEQSEYMNSSIDIWIITDNIECGKIKLKQITDQLLSNLKKKSNFCDDYVFVRTNNNISLISKHPFRRIRFMVEFHHSEKEIISFFDFDCIKSIYNGENVFVLPKTINSFNTRSNLISSLSSILKSRSDKYIKLGFRHIFCENIQLGDVPINYRNSFFNFSDLIEHQFEYNYKYNTRFSVYNLYSKNDKSNLIAVVRDVDFLISIDINTIIFSSMYWGLREDFYQDADPDQYPHVYDFSLFNALNHPNNNDIDENQIIRCW